MSNFWDGDPTSNVKMDEFDYSRVTIQEVPIPH